jgi:hypothetical protein
MSILLSLLKRLGALFAMALAIVAIRWIVALALDEFQSPKGGILEVGRLAFLWIAKPSTVTILLSAWVLVLVVWQLRPVWHGAYQAYLTGIDARRVGFIRVITADPNSDCEDNRTEQDISGDEEAIIEHKKEAIRCAENVSLLLSSGIADLGTPQQRGPLYTLLENVRSVRVLLLDPNCREAFSREEQYDNRIPERPVFLQNTTYRKAIIEVLKNLNTITHDDLRIKLYRQRPTFKVLITDQLAWVQAMKTANLARKGTLVGYDINDHSLFHLWSDLFQKKWTGYNESRDFIDQDLIYQDNPND